jgi:hypothetical protein
MRDDLANVEASFAERGTPVDISWGRSFSRSFLRRVNGISTPRM